MTKPERLRNHSASLRLCARTNSELVAIEDLAEGFFDEGGVKVVHGPGETVGSSKKVETNKDLFSNLVVMRQALGPEPYARFQRPRTGGPVPPGKVGTLSESADRDFRVSQPFLRRIEDKSRVPSPFKLLTLARIYQVPLAVFFKAIGATDAEICGHEVTMEQARLAELMKDERFAQAHALLQKLLESDKAEAKAAVTILETVAGEVGRRKKKAS